MIGNNDDPRLAAAVGEAFGRTSRTMREKANRSLGKQEKGSRGRREEAYTSDLSDYIDDMSKELKEACDGPFPGPGNSMSTRVSVRYFPHELQVGDETDYGADIGSRVVIESESYVAVKGILVQCKRMFRPRRNPSYDMLRVHGERQARTMLRLTPASFFFLYNFGEYETLKGMARDRQRSILPLPLPPGVVLPAQRYFLDAGSGGDPHDFGIAVLPATRVLALSAAAKIEKKPFPVDARLILPGCRPFGEFMLNLFTSCFVGDPRTAIVDLVTPPAERGLRLPESSTVDSDDDFAGFAVRKYIHIRVSV